MKFVYLLLIGLMTSTVAHAQTVNINDPIRSFCGKGDINNFSENMCIQSAQHPPVVNATIVEDTTTIQNVALLRQEVSDLRQEVSLLKERIEKSRTFPIP